MEDIEVITWVPLFKSIPIVCDPVILSDVRRKQGIFLSTVVDLIQRNYHDISSVSVEGTPPPEKIWEEIKSFNFLSTTRMTSFMQVKSVVSIDVDRLREVNSGKQLERHFIEHCAASRGAEALEEICLIAELAIPGALDCLPGLSLAGETSSEVRSKHALTQILAPDENDPQWPPLLDLSLNETDSWARRLGFGRRSYGEKRIERSLAALTHVIGLTLFRQSEALFRSMQGLESLYCDGVGDLRRQLTEKVRIWLGDWHEGKNIIGALYDARSKYVHGSSPIEYWNHHKDLYTENEKMANEIHYFSLFAVRLLLVSLQHCARSQATNLNWSYTVHINR